MPTAAYARLKASPIYARKTFDESKVHRGQPGNAGQFGPGGGSGGGKPKPDRSAERLRNLHSNEHTHEGVKRSEAKTLTREQAREALAWHDNMTLIGGSNGPNKSLPDASRPKLTDEQRGALQKYSYKNDVPLNGMLRGKPDWDKNSPYGPEFFAEMHAQMQSAFEAAKPFDKPVPVVRGMKLPPEAAADFAAKMQASAQSGEPITFTGYTSTTRPDGLMYRLGLDTGVRKPFRGSITMKINATHGLDMSPHSQLTGEGEILLPHGAQFKVAGVKKVGDGYHIMLDQIPPSKPATTKGVGALRSRLPMSDKATDAALRKFVEEHPEHLSKWVDTDADFVRFGTDE